MSNTDELVPLFESWREKIETLIKEHPLQIISWEATRRCNLNCLHCGSPSEKVNIADELNTEEIVGAFEEIARDFDMSKFRHINITGGEPFIRDDLIFVLKSIYKYSFYRNIDIQTNGVFIADNPDVLGELKKVGVTGLGISIDGFETTHDILRGKSGTWQKAVDASKRSVDEGYVVTVSFVAHSKNILELPEFYNYVKKEIKPRVFRVMFIDEQGRAVDNNEYLLNPEQIRDVIKFLKKMYQETCSNYSDISSTMIELGCGGWLGTDLEGKVRPFIFHCIAGLNNLGILYDGKLGSCSNISRDFIQGDLKANSILNIWRNKYIPFRNNEWKKKGMCKNCSQWDYCHGGPMHTRSYDRNSPHCIYLVTK